MFVLAKRNIIIPSTEPGIQPVALKKDGFADVPELAEYSLSLIHIFCGVFVQVEELA